MSDTTELLDLALRTAVEAGREVLEVYAREFSVEEKADNSPLTEADRRSHEKIVSHLNAGSPDIPVLSEEGVAIPYDERKSWTRFWMVDPLDGTKEFIKKNGEFTVNIALMEGEGSGHARPVAGVVLAPYMRTLFVGAEGLGAYRANCKVDGACPDISELLLDAEELPSIDGQRRYTIVASRSHMTPETQKFVEERRREHPDLELVSAGSSLKLCRVAQGAADEYPRFAPTMEWDTAAGDAVARAAGCEVVAWGAEDGAPKGALVYNKPDLHNPWFLVRR